MAIPRERVAIYAKSQIPTPYGSFEVVVFRTAGGDEHLALTRGDVAGAEDVLARVHSECFTGEVLNSLKCDCREQLDEAMRRVDAAGRGVIVYLRQEGRGIGLGNKIRAYALQERGADTVEANRMLGFEDDGRSYEVAAEILRGLAVRSVVLMTNNPRKLEGLASAGIAVHRREPITIEPNAHNRAYLDTKRERMGHLIGDPESAGSNGSANR